jgi:hypothetical protein
MTDKQLLRECRDALEALIPFVDMQADQYCQELTAEYNRLLDKINASLREPS